ncbi:MAG TPA: glutamate racemase [Lichenihabitans sp.]|jgi:glutamate racemase|nr:glutamate racemase [Lichenihabitans sp.]
MTTAVAASPPPAAEAAASPARILVFDSGLGGLTVFAEIRRLWAEADYLYAADDAVFPYGGLSEADLVARVMTLMETLVLRHRPQAVVIACHTASTLVLPPLRGRWPGIPFVGTVPAIKPAAAASRSKRISVLGTPGTVARDYTRNLVRSFAADCDVALVGAPRLAALAEAAMRGEPVRDDDILSEIAPAFVDAGGRRTDAVVLACTHYPLLLDAFERLAPWPVTYIDPAPAIARRLESVLADLGLAPQDHADGGRATALFTSARRPGRALREALEHRGFAEIATL